VETIDSSDHFPCGGSPNENRDQLAGDALGLAFKTAFFYHLGFTDRLNLIEFIICHLTSCYDVKLRVNCHCNDVVTVHIEELLLIRFSVMNNTNSSSCVDYVTCFVVLEVASDVPASETMSPLQSHAYLRSLVSIFSWNPVGWG